jgi:hypothetical protein
MELKACISARRITLFLILIVLLLTLASLAGRAVKFYLGFEQAFGLINLLNVDNEGSIATWYSSAALLFCSILLAVIAMSKMKSGAPHIVYWIALSVVFIWLSVDEAISIHERVFDHLYYSWKIPGVIAVLIFGLIFLRFVVLLPTKTRYLFIIAGVLFVAGALGFEYVAFKYWEQGNNIRSMAFALFSTIEEFLEMIGIVIFIYALIDYMNSYGVTDIELHIED